MKTRTAPKPLPRISNLMGLRPGDRVTLDDGEVRIVAGMIGLDLNRRPGAGRVLVPSLPVVRPGQYYPKEIRGTRIVEIVKRGSAAEASR